MMSRKTAEWHRIKLKLVRENQLAADFHADKTGRKDISKKLHKALEESSAPIPADVSAVIPAPLNIYLLGLLVSDASSFPAHIDPSM